MGLTAVTHQLVARQRPGFVGAQHIIGGRLMDGRQSGQQYSPKAFSASLAGETRGSATVLAGLSLLAPAFEDFALALKGKDLILQG